jgi:hypothetical protein
MICSECERLRHRLSTYTLIKFTSLLNPVGLNGANWQEAIYARDKVELNRQLMAQ